MTIRELIEDIIDAITDNNSIKYIVKSADYDVRSKTLNIYLNTKNGIKATYISEDIDKLDINNGIDYIVKIFFVSLFKYHYEVNHININL